MVTCYLVRRDNTPERAAFPVIDLHNHLSGDWGDLDRVVGVMDETGVACYGDMTANTRVTWEAGGYVVAQGTPEQVAQVENSYTGQFLKKIL